MNVRELNRNQLKELKERYLCELSNMGIYEDVMNVDYEEPTYEDLANADKLVSDETIFAEFADMEFSEDDFWGCRDMTSYDEGRESVQADVQKVINLMDATCRRDGLGNKSKTELVKLLSDVYDMLGAIVM